jgi:hypothetical protein
MVGLKALKLIPTSHTLISQRFSSACTAASVSISFFFFFFFFFHLDELVSLASSQSELIMKF